MIKCAAKLVALIGLLTSFYGCSPAYVLRAGTEEMSILWRREPIAELLKDPALDQTTRQKFELVLAAREFAAAHKMKTKGSFAQFSKIDRDVLSWVLGASDKTQFKLKTWWFPIVGRVPYKGFFEKADGIVEAKKLQAKGLDVTLRPTLAYSTLGWFDDPLLSTTLRVDEVALVETVLHEIFHNTAWVKNEVSFNETAANAIGQIGAEEFFKSRNDAQSKIQAAEAAGRWQEQIKLASALTKLKGELSELYARDIPAEEKLKLRFQVYAAAQNDWLKHSVAFKTKRYLTVFREMNNASLLGTELYLKDSSLFDALYHRCGSFQSFLDALVEISKTANKENKNPFDLLNNRVHAM